ncbi:MAG: OmpA family protein [Draconibacterium sp.]
MEETLTRKPKLITDVLAPVLGKTIRRSINIELGKLLQSINNIIDQTLTVKGIKWHYLSWVTGKPYSEIAMLKTLGYQIKHVLLIHNETGLLLNEAHQTKLLKDPNMVSSMLSAIKSFVQESISGAGDKNLNSIEVGENQIWVETQPEISLAVVIEGFPPHNLRKFILETAESLQLKFNVRLKHFNGDTSVYGPSLPDLMQCLHYKDERHVEKPKHRFRLATVVLAAAAVFLVFLIVRWGIVQYRYNHFLKDLHQSEGIFVTHSKTSRGTLYIKGLRKLNSKLPITIASGRNINSTKLYMEWELIRAVDNSDLSEILLSGIEIPSTFSVNFNRQTIELLGSIGQETYDKIIRQAGNAFPSYEIVNNGINVVSKQELGQHISAIEHTVLYFKPSSDSLTAESHKSSLQLIAKLEQLNSLCKILLVDYQLELIGHSDIKGTNRSNLYIAEKRAKKVQEQLEKNGIDKIKIQIRSMGSKITETENIDESKKRRVNIRIKLIQ